jgi:hypothetical protein
LSFGDTILFSNACHLLLEWPLRPSPRAIDRQKI